MKGAEHMTQARKEYDAIIIGGGAGGLAVCALLAGEGLRTLLDENLLPPGWRESIGKLASLAHEDPRPAGGSCVRPSAAAFA